MICKISSWPPVWLIFYRPVNKLLTLPHILTTRGLIIMKLWLDPGWKSWKDLCKILKDLSKILARSSKNHRKSLQRSWRFLTRSLKIFEDHWWSLTILDKIFQDLSKKTPYYRWIFPRRHEASGYFIYCETNSPIGFIQIQNIFRLLNFGGYINSQWENSKFGWKTWLSGKILQIEKNLIMRKP